MPISAIGQDSGTQLGHVPVQLDLAEVATLAANSCMDVLQDILHRHVRSSEPLVGYIDNQCLDPASAMEIPLLTLFIGQANDVTSINESGRELWLGST
ncbi:hypothetical protein CHU94_14460 [Rhodoferax sp. TH121]|nr:hypothetical protein CHU94_14460 [Rhodoferax sp. TH121]